MQDMIYEEIETKQNEVIVRLEFPQTSEKEKNIRKEVKQILSTLLWEHLDQGWNEGE